MSNAASAPDFLSREVLHAICGNCGEIVRVHMPDSRPREIRLWWPIPLAAIIWLAIIWKFAPSLIVPKVETAAPAPVEARFVELPEVAAELPAKPAEVRPKAPPRQADKPKIKPPPDAAPRNESAAVKPEIPADAAPDLTPPTDLMAYVNAARERRRAAEMPAAREPSADEIRMANIKRNLQPQGTNGIFQIISLGLHTGKFSFRGWTTGSSNSRRELIEVDAGPNGDLERAMVRSMIELIRRYYKGNFNWESQRLDRVIVLSARLEDNAGLEDFMLREFFGTPARPPVLSRNGIQ
ncbi:MAG: hypothetical protein ABFE02_11280 [Sulfuricella sp.]